MKSSPPAVGEPDTPDYLNTHYRWAYVTSRAVQIFERHWLVNLILWGNCAELRNLALQALGERLDGETLQIGCVYGNLTEVLCRRLGPQGRLDVVDVLPVQLRNLRRKLDAAGTSPSAVGLHLADSASLDFAPQTYDRVLLFFCCMNNRMRSGARPWPRRSAC
jgi:ubiquinone/menaquinone biosynthesis C-methylase UbiE